MESVGTTNYDALVLGGGIAGMQSALDIADQGFKVVLVERTATIGGNMIKLSKVFPTLDCASCITTPKMAQVAHHPNITLMSLATVSAVAGQGGDFQVTVNQEPRYINEEDCIGCMKCEQSCPVMIPSEDQGGMAARKAVYIPMSNAVPPVPRLKMDECMLCGKCAKVCPTGAVDYFEEAREVEINVKTMVVCTGYSLLKEFPARVWGQWSEQPNLIDALQMERILAPTGPYLRLLRPSDGKEPRSVAFIQCAGSRDTQKGVPYCSRVCCMYNIKQATLIARALPDTEVTICYLDLRCFGKGYEQFLQNARKLGIKFVRGKAVVVGRGEDDGVVLRYEDIEGTGGPSEHKYDMAVLSLALIPAWRPDGTMGLEIADDGFIAATQPKLAATLTNMDGVFMAGVSAGPKDIVDTVIEAGAAASEAAIYMRELAVQDQDAA